MRSRTSNLRSLFPRHLNRTKYGYDGRGYRVQKVIAGGDTFDYYQNDSNQTIEVRKNGDADAFECYVFDHRYIDAPVMVYRDTDTDGSNVQSAYVTQDANFDVTAIVDGSTGTVINRFVFTPYGYRTVYTATWTAASTDFSLGHQGLMLDTESGLYYNRARYLHTSLGVFITRDPLGYADGGNLYQYVRSSPAGSRDPAGLGTGVWPHEPPTIDTSKFPKCDIRMTIGFPIPHATILVDTGNGLYTIDGQGPLNVGITIDLFEHPRPIDDLWQNGNPVSLCACLLGSGDGSVYSKTNKAFKDYLWGGLFNNSNMALSCFMHACGAPDMGKAPPGWRKDPASCPCLDK